jgi:hypothetical protein
MAQAPPLTTAPTGPKRAAAMPDSTSPSSLETEMNSRAYPPAHAVGRRHLDERLAHIDGDHVRGAGEREHRQ